MKIEKVKDVLSVLSECDPEADVDVTVFCRPYRFTVSACGSEGVTRKNANKITFYVDDLCSQDKVNGAAYKQERMQKARKLEVAIMNALSVLDLNCMQHEGSDLIDDAIEILEEAIGEGGMPTPGTDAFIYAEAAKISCED